MDDVSINKALERMFRAGRGAWRHPVDNYDGYPTYMEKLSTDTWGYPQGDGDISTGRIDDFVEKRSFR